MIQHKQRSPSAPPTPPTPRAGWALFLDFDGTLVDIAATPDAVQVAPQLIDRLAAVRQRLSGALAIVSGREIASIDAYLSPLRLPTAGLHGLEMRLPNGTIERAGHAATTASEARAKLQDFAARYPEVLLEDKGLSLALHYRSAPRLGQACLDAAGAAAEGSGLTVLPGKMVVELKPSGYDKGKVVEHYLQFAPFHGRKPVFVGDDVTDEDGFRAVNERQGISIRVGGDGATQARYRLSDVTALLAWLNDFQRRAS